MRLRLTAPQLGRGSRWLCTALAVCLAALPVDANAAPPPDAASAEDLPKAPKPKKRVPPRYPEKALYKAVDGDVTVAVTIDGEGEATAVQVLEETPRDMGFGEAAVDSVSDWVFEPGRPGRYRVEIRFRSPGVSGPTQLDFKAPMAPMPDFYVPPVYPPDALEAGQTGTAELIAVVLAHGHVDEAASLQDHTTSRDFAEAAYRAILEWKFADDIKPGQYRIRVDFNPQTLASGLVKPKQPKLAVSYWGSRHCGRRYRDAPEPLHRVAPVHPASSADTTKGRAHIHVRIDGDGRVEATDVISESPGGKGFGVAAAQAVAQWHFPEAFHRYYHLDIEFGK